MSSSYLLSMVIRDNLSYQKPPLEITKLEKREKIKSLYDEIVLLAEVEDKKNKYKIKPQGARENIFRISPKIDGVRIRLQWESFKQGGILRWECSAPYEYKDFLIDSEKTSAKIENCMNCFWTLLNGNRLERIKLRKATPLPDSYWNGWEGGKEIYRKLVYKVALAYLNTLKPESVIEICGGDGEFASLALQQKEIKSYTLIEQNEKSYKSASKLLDEFISQNRATILSQNVVSDDWPTLIQKKVQVVIGLGALTEYVMPSRKEALQALQKAAACVEDGGVLLFMGATSSWLQSSDFEQLGFEVKNSFCPEAMQFKEANPELYIAKKVDKVVISEWNSMPSYPTEIICLSGQELFGIGGFGH